MPFISEDCPRSNWTSPIMPQTLGYITLVVRDYDEAIAFFAEKLEFQLMEDTDLGNGKR
jgi:hypothetical protein